MANYKDTAKAIRNSLQIRENISSRKVKVEGDKNGVTVTCKVDGLDMAAIKRVLDNYTMYTVGWDIVTTPITLIDFNGNAKKI